MHLSNDCLTFKGINDALIFAFNQTMSGYEIPAMHRMAIKPSAREGLTPIESAAQAGMIRAEVAAIGVLHEAILTAKYAPKTHPCSCKSPCCAGETPNREWTDSVSYLTNFVKPAFAGCNADYRLRRGCVQIYFGHKIGVGDVAELTGVARNTVSAHVKRANKALSAAELQAEELIDIRLRESGLIS